MDVGDMLVVMKIVGAEGKDRWRRQRWVRSWVRSAVKLRRFGKRDRYCLFLILTFTSAFARIASYLLPAVPQASATILHKRE